MKGRKRKEEKETESEMRKLVKIIKSDGYSVTILKKN